MRILLIEEDTPVRQMVGRMLARAGYQVIEAASGADGLRLWHTERTHLVITYT
jgi:DNA-binding response OmpR family regulator